MKMDREKIIELASPLEREFEDNQLTDQAQELISTLIDTLAEDMDPLSALAAFHIYGGASVQLEAALGWAASDAENLALISLIKELVERVQADGET